MAQVELTEPVAFRRKLDKADFRRMNLPEAYWLAKVQGVQDAVREPVVNYLRKIDEMISMGAGLWIAGPEGTGKTSIAALAAKEARARGFTCYFTSIWELRECIRSRVGFDADTSILQRCRDVDLLVLDELRVEDANTPFFGGMELEALLAHRRAEQRVTILTTRLDADKLDQHFPGLRSAVEGGMVWLPVKGRNLRQDRSKALRNAVFGS
jgi:DNA replication protein DnaC